MGPTASTAAAAVLRGLSSSASRMPRVDADLKLDFKDVLFRPKRSSLRSRSEVGVAPVTSSGCSAAGQNAFAAGFRVSQPELTGGAVAGSPPSGGQAELKGTNTLDLEVCVWSMLLKGAGFL